MTVKDIIELFKSDSPVLDLEAVVFYAQKCAQSKKVSPELARELKAIKSESSEISVEAARVILMSDGLNAADVLQTLWSSGHIPLFMEPFILHKIRIDRDWEEGWWIPEFSEGSWELSMNDFSDWESFVTKLKRPPKDDGISQYLNASLAKFHPDTLALISKYSGGKCAALEEKLILTLNLFLRHNSLYLPVHRANASLSSETMALLCLNTHNLPRINRMLLHDAYPKEIVRKKPICLRDDELELLGGQAVQIMRVLLGNAVAYEKRPKAAGTEELEIKSIGTPLKPDYSGVSRATRPTAAEVCAQLAITLVKSINMWKRHNPKIFQAVSHKEVQWPILKSRHPRFCESEDKLLEDVGTAHAFPVDACARWNPDDLGTKIAMELYEYLLELREDAKFAVKDVEEADQKKRFSHVPLIPLVAKLEEFGPETAEAWWALAEQFFKYSYPDPLIVPGLLILAKTNSKASIKAGPSRSANKKPPGVIRRDIFHNLKGKFISLAGR